MLERLVQPLTCIGLSQAYLNVYQFSSSKAFVARKDHCKLQTRLIICLRQFSTAVLYGNEMKSFRRELAHQGNQGVVV